MSKTFDPFCAYKLAEIYSARGDVSRPWYVYYFYKKPGSDTFTMFKKTLGINRIKDYRKRMEAARQIQKVINETLLSGDLNPFRKERGTGIVDACAEKYMSEHVSNLRPRTISSVKSAMKLFRDKFGKDSMDEITGSEIKSYLVFLSSQRKWQNKTYNGTLVYWKAFFNYYRRQDPPLIEKNPCDSIQYLKEYPSDLTRPPTEEEFITIVNHLYQNDKQLFLFAMFIYYMGYRVTETGILKRSSFEFKAENPYIRLAAKDQKDNEESIQFISPHLLPFLYEMQIDQLPTHFYLFAKDLLPADKPLIKIKDLVETRWRNVVKKGLGIKVNLYSMKHKQATELGERTNDKEISLFLRHSSEEVTRGYMRNKRAQVPITFFHHQRPLPLKSPTKIINIK